MKMENRRSSILEWCALALLFGIVTLTTISADTNEWAVSKFDVRHVTYNWKIPNYSKNGKEYGEVILSDKFSGNDSTEFEWQLQWYPRGHTPETRAYASLYLDLVTKQNVWAKVEFAMLYKGGTWTQHRKFEKRYPGQWGIPLYIGQGWLKDGYAYYWVPEDTLTISVDIVFNAGLIRASKHCSIINTEPCTSLPFTPEFRSDLYLIVEGKRVNLHKAAINAHSGWARDKLLYEPNAAGLYLPKDVQLEVFKKALEFIYTGKTNADEEMLKKLLVLSERLAMKKLKLYVEEALCNGMTSKNADEILKVAKKTNAKNLEREANSFLLAAKDGVVTD